MLPRTMINYLIESIKDLSDAKEKIRSGDAWGAIKDISSAARKLGLIWMSIRTPELARLYMTYKRMVEILSDVVRGDQSAMSVLSSIIGKQIKSVEEAIDEVQKRLSSIPMLF
ncbi:MAG: hypothetical protein DRJ47_06650 [Thermoprotei archaeon]|nr:MAG: hypothetical protein DRJ47_06650 [Thermoprotei archaeon]